jgi:anti-anti-sigma factor
MRRRQSHHFHNETVLALEPMEIPNLDTSVAFENGCACVVVSGDLDLSTAPKLWSALEPAIEQGAQTVVLDISGVGFLDSSGVSVIVRALKVLRDADRSLVVRSPQLQARKVLEITGLTGVLTIEG